MAVTLEFFMEEITVMVRLIHDLPPLPLEVEMSRVSGLQRPMVAGSDMAIVGEMASTGFWIISDMGGVLGQNWHCSPDAVHLILTETLDSNSSWPPGAAHRSCVATNALTDKKSADQRHAEISAHVKLNN